MRFTVGHVLPHISTPLRVQVLAIGFLALVRRRGPPDATRSPRSVLGWRPPPPPASTPSGSSPPTRPSPPAPTRAPASSGGSLTHRQADGTGQLRRDAAGRWARWTSGWVTPGLAFTQLIPSWNVVTPANTAVQVQARVRSTRRDDQQVQDGRHLVLARRPHPSHAAAGAQRDAVARVNTDTLQAVSGVALNGYQLRVLPLRTPGSTATPTVRSRARGGQPPRDAPAGRRAGRCTAARRSPSRATRR